jgi:hypothetical protein
MERQLVPIWEELLGVHPVGITLRAFFTAPTIATLATAVVEGTAEGVDAEALSRTLEELRDLPDGDGRRRRWVGNV